MAYQLKSITIRTDNSPNGLAQIAELWQDIQNRTLPLLYASEHALCTDTSPISMYSNYSSDENGSYDLTILAADDAFFAELEQKTALGLFIKYEKCDDGDIQGCTTSAWENVWADQSAGAIKRTFAKDYEMTVPVLFSDDGKAHCDLYIAV